MLVCQVNFAQRYGVSITLSFSDMGSAIWGQHHIKFSTVRFASYTENKLLEDQTSALAE